MHIKIKKSTPVPNILFDTLLPHLKPAELKVLLVIIRQTLGYIAKGKPGKQRKQRDWINRTQFMSKTGLSHKAVSGALTSLQEKNVISITDYRNNPLGTSEERRTCQRIYYALTKRWWEKSTHVRVKTSPKVCKNFSHMEKKGDTTKEILTKENIQKIEKIKRKLRARWGKPKQLSQKRIS